MNQHYIKLYQHKYLIDLDISELFNIKNNMYMSRKLMLKNKNIDNYYIEREFDNDYKEIYNLIFKFQFLIINFNKNKLLIFKKEKKIRKIKRLLNNKFCNDIQGVITSFLF